VCSNRRFDSDQGGPGPRTANTPPDVRDLSIPCLVRRNAVNAGDSPQPPPGGESPDQDSPLSAKSSAPHVPPVRPRSRRPKALPSIVVLAHRFAANRLRSGGASPCLAFLASFLPGVPLPLSVPSCEMNPLCVLRRELLHTAEIVLSPPNFRVAFRLCCKRPPIRSPVPVAFSTVQRRLENIETLRTSFFSPLKSRGPSRNSARTPNPFYFFLFFCSTKKKNFILRHLL